MAKLVAMMEPLTLGALVAIANVSDLERRPVEASQRGTGYGRPDVVPSVIERIR